MNRSQFIFSMTCAAVLMLAGYQLATTAVASWGLFWVGSAVAAVSLSTLARERIARLGQQPGLVPVRMDS